MVLLVGSEYFLTSYSAAQSAFAIQFDHHNFTVVSADFTPIVPYVTNTLWIQPGQRANIILHANQVSDMLPATTVPANSL